MAYDEHLVDRISRILQSEYSSFEEKALFGGIVFMVNGKMCMGVVENRLMARIGPDAYNEALTKEGCSEMDFTGKPMIGYVYIEPEAIDEDEDLDYWVKLALVFNPKAKRAQKKKK